MKRLFFLFKNINRITMFLTLVDGNGGICLVNTPSSVFHFNKAAILCAGGRKRENWGWLTHVKQSLRLVLADRLDGLLMKYRLIILSVNLLTVIADKGIPKAVYYQTIRQVG